MKAARLHGARDVRIEDIPTPAVGPGEVLLRVRAVAICPSDWRLYVDGHAGGVALERPIVQGHEFSGEVVALGEGVSEPAVGTRVAVEPSWSCGSCDMCRAGRGNICRHVVFPSFPPHNGALAEYIAAPARFVCPLPDEVGDVAGALAEPLGVGIHAVRLSGLMAGETVVTLGAGVIGVSVLHLARQRGAGRMCVVEPSASRRHWPAELGADPVVASYQDLVDAGIEADVVFECSGAAEGLDQAVRLARPGGRVMVVGIPRDERITFDMSVARRHELTVHFCRRSNETLHEAVDLIRRGVVGFDRLHYRTYALEQAAAAIEATGEQCHVLRSIVTP